LVGSTGSRSGALLVYGIFAIALENVMKYSREVVQQVRELMERGDAHYVSLRLHIDPAIVQAIMDFINGVT
jgi:hypothetical protein